MIERERGRTTRSFTSSADCPTRETTSPAFCGSILHITFTSM